MLRAKTSCRFQGRSLYFSRAHQELWSAEMLLLSGVELPYRTGVGSGTEAAGLHPLHVGGKHGRDTDVLLLIRVVRRAQCPAWVFLQGV